MRKSEIKKSTDNDLLVDYIQSISSLFLNFNAGKRTNQLSIHCSDLEKEIVSRGILTEEDIRKVNGNYTVVI